MGKLRLASKDVELYPGRRRRTESPSSGFTTSGLICNSLVIRVSVSLEKQGPMLLAGQEQWQGKGVEFWSFCLT